MRNPKRGSSGANGNGNTTHRNDRFSLGNFVRDVVSGAVMGGLASVTFYGAGKAVEALKDGIYTGNRQRGLLKAEIIERYMPNGKVMVDVSNLPGYEGINVKRRLKADEMRFLTREYGVEFALIYEYGKGTNGRGGTYWLYSGIENKVKFPLSKNKMLIYHTHPAGYLYTPSKDDYKLMKTLFDIGSKQKKSTIIPVEENFLIEFNKVTWQKVFK